jgi:predicted DCC family thiol-disulfide oxidoreductase YuxK
MATALPTTEPPTALPSPAERPDADIVVFDGHCGFCTAQIKNLLRWDKDGCLAYLSLHDEEVERRWPGIDHDRLMKEMMVVDLAGNQYWGPEAIRYFTRRLRGLWWAAWIFYIPGAMFVWRRIYRWVARNRYRISAKFSKSSCDSGTCQLHFKR